VTILINPASVRVKNRILNLRTGRLGKVLGCEPVHRRQTAEIVNYLVNYSYLSRGLAVAAKKEAPKSKQGPPIAFRPGPELEQLVSRFASDRSLSVHEAFRDLAAVAVVGLDVRYFDLIAQMADGAGARNTFVRAVLRIYAELLGAERITGQFVWAEGDRARFVAQTVKNSVEARGGQVPLTVVELFVAQFPPVSAGESTGEVDSWNADGAEASQGERLKVHHRARR
jgi:hypothetical protein